MKRLFAAIALVLIATPSFAIKSCDELKTEIDAKLQAKGVKDYTLTIVTNDEAKEKTEKVVGSCEGGTKQILYSRGR